MADCTASGTAIDRVIQSAVASTLNQGANNGAATSSAAAAASRAMGNFFGGTVATAGPSNVMGMEGASTAIMPMAPLESIGGMHAQHQQQHQQQGGIIMDSSRMDEAWAASTTMSAPQHEHAPMTNHNMMNNHHAHPNMPMQQIHAHHPQQMMMQQQHQQQQQMMMMQQMQMQQYQMAAMVQYQQQQQQMKQQQQQQQNAKAQSQKEAAAKRSESATANYKTNVNADIDEDVATVSEEEQLHHEGLTEDASVERLAQAWRDAEAEFAEEFGDDEYDVSDMGGLYSEGYAEATAADTATATNNDAGNNNNMAEPTYDFSEASRTYGCLQTPSTDIAPQNLNYPENLYERGLQHFDEGAISEAILCFESTLRNIDPEHADAWRMLGKCHTENDEDSKAISCWHRSLERDPFSPETLLALGVAYVNELDHENAIETLKNWVGNHPSYAGMAIGDAGELEGEEDLYGNAVEDDRLDGAGPSSVPRMRARTVASMRDVERLLLRASEYDSTADGAADVYEALGVVYNVSRDYDAAVDSFRRAIAVRPDDYQLRNKLGATLANSDRSEEALPNYRAALRLKPKYARGWLNMAISHSNMHNYSEAARCYLQTLSLNPEAQHVWSYLRIALTCDENWDLLPLAASRDLAGFRDHFDFVEY